MQCARCIGRTRTLPVHPGSNERKTCAPTTRLGTRTTDTQRRHKSKKSEILSRYGRQNMLWPYLKIWDWDLIFGRAVKVISSPGVRSPCHSISSTLLKLLNDIKLIQNDEGSQSFSLSLLRVQIKQMTVPRILLHFTY